MVFDKNRSKLNLEVVVKKPVQDKAGFDHEYLERSKK